MNERTGSDLECAEGGRAHIYLAAIRQQAPRVLSLLDREELSPTFGCLDRTYWAWKFVDFPGARFQEGLCVLALLCSERFDDNPYYQNDLLRRWIAGGFEFWARIQRATGDFDEAYPFERSLAATAFTSFYLSEAWNFLGGDLPGTTGGRFKRALERAGDWLIRNDETHGFLSNHLAAAAAALYHAYRITGEARFEVRSRHFIDKILSRQSPEGWYDEYGGTDPGYQTHGSFYLARYIELSGDAAVRDSLCRSFEFLAHFVHPDLSLGGEYASRNTQTYYPAAFEMMAARSAAAHWIAQEMAPAVSSLAAAGLGTVDAYNFFPLLNNYVFAYIAAAAQGAPAIPAVGPSLEPGVVHFPQAGLLKVRKPSYDLYVGLRKGGVLKLFDRRSRRLAFSNCGYIGRLKNGRLFSNQWDDAGRPMRVGDGQAAVEGCFYQISRPVLNPFTFLLFRLFSLTVGRFKQAAYFVKSLLVKVLIYRKRELDLRFSRRIVFGENYVELHDHLEGGLGEEIVTLAPGAVFTTIHMGSSRYFVPNELLSSTTAQDDFTAPVDPALLRAGLDRRCRISFD